MSLSGAGGLGLRAVRARPASVVLVGLSLALVACRSPAKTTSFPCPDDPLRGVYDRRDFEVQGECRSVKGTVTEVSAQKGGDLLVLLKPDPDSERFLAAGNYNRLGGAMPAIVMRDQDLPAPVPGEHVSVFGTWVFRVEDEVNAVYPIWGIRYPDRGLSGYAFPASEPLQAGTICWRRASDGLEILLVRASRHEWSFPKGHIEPGESTAETAARETREETGVTGQVDPEPFAFFLHPEASSRHEELVAVHLMRAVEEGQPAEVGRQSGWFTPEEAKRILGEGRYRREATALQRVVDDAVASLGG